MTAIARSVDINDVSSAGDSTGVSASAQITNQLSDIPRNRSVRPIAAHP
ncbi:MAG: hypothetical protein U1E21_00490 [Reyranellaceae bacterium]